MPQAKRIMDETLEQSHTDELAHLEAVVHRHPLNREVLYHTLNVCREERVLHEIEESIFACPEFAQCTQNPYRLITILTEAGGLHLIERTEDGSEVQPADKEGLTENEIDDLVASLNYITTDSGAALVENNQRETRITQLLASDAGRRDVYTEVLEFIAETPRSYQAVKSYLEGNPALTTVIEGRYETMQPSVFIDKLERAGALVWQGCWKLTDEGAQFLHQLKTSQTLPAL